MFDLDQAILAWRKQMFRSGIKSLILDELESHLRQDVERLTRAGKTPSECFDLATRNLGNAATLGPEFAKRDGGVTAMEKLRIGIAAVFIAFILFLSTVSIWFCFGGYGERLVAAAAVISILFVACGWKHAVPFLPLIRGGRLRWVAGLACIGSGFIISSVFCEVVLRRFEVDPDHMLPAIGLWAVFLIAIFFCAGIGLLLSERERKMWGMSA